MSGNPKTKELCQSVLESAKLGAVEAGAEIDEIKLCYFKMVSCEVCGDGWGTCRLENNCIYGSDGFDKIKTHILSSDANISA